MKSNINKSNKNSFKNMILHFVIGLILPLVLLINLRNTDMKIGSNNAVSVTFLSFFTFFSLIIFIAKLKDNNVVRKLKCIFFSFKRKYSLLSINDKQRNLFAAIIPLIFFIITYVVAQNADEAANEVYNDYNGNPFNFRNTWFYWMVGIVVVFLIEFKLFETKK
jgi:hypothetical protein